GNLVARYHGTGTGGRPIVVFAHLDVVPARRADWSVDPFALLEKDGYFYGRGTTDDKVGDAILVADFIRLKRAGFKPRRDLILMLTGDEETAGSCIAWLVTKHRDLIDAEFALNTDAGGGVLRDGRRVMFVVQASEKVYATYVLEATDKGGHSSDRGFKPRRDLILMLTGDEETAGSCIAWLVTKHRDLIDAEFALNTDAGGGVLRDGRRVMFVVQASEKVYATYVLEATDKGGHS